MNLELSQSLFYWITYSYDQNILMRSQDLKMSQSLFYWITYSYSGYKDDEVNFKTVSILILLDYLFLLLSL